MADRSLSALSERDFEPDAVFKRADRLKVGMVTHEYGKVLRIDVVEGGFVQIEFYSASFSAYPAMKLFRVDVPYV